MSTESGPRLDRALRRDAFINKGSETFTTVETNTQRLLQFNERPRIKSIFQKTKLLQATQFDNVITEKTLKRCFIHEFCGAFTSFRKFPVNLKMVRELAIRTTSIYSEDHNGVDGLSFGDCSFCRRGAIYVIYSYCVNEESLVAHLHAYLGRASRVMSPGVQVLINIFTGSSEQVAIIHKVLESVGTWIPGAQWRETVDMLEPNIEFYRNSNL